MSETVKCPKCEAEITSSVEVEFIGWHGKCVKCVWNEIPGDGGE